MPADWSVDALLAFASDNRGLGTLLFGLMAFGESLAFVGVLVPATGIMIAAGTLVGAGVIPFWELWIGGAVGAALGDAVSYWIGRRLGPGIETMWPFRSRPHWLAAGERVFERWGWAAVFIGRFIGPLRATVPLAAGILGMRHGLFQLVNISSAIVWIPVLIAPGAALSWVYELFREGRRAEAFALLGLVVAVVVAVFVLARRYAPRILGNGGGGSGGGKSDS